MSGFKKMALYEVYLEDKKIDCDIIDNLASRYHTTANCIRSTMWHHVRLNGMYTFQKTGEFVLYMNLSDFDIIPYVPKYTRKETKEPTYEETMLMHLKTYGNFALGSNEKNPAKYLPKLYELGFDCKINTYTDPSIRTTHRKPKKYYSIEVVRYV